MFAPVLRKLGSPARIARAALGSLVVVGVAAGLGHGAAFAPPVQAQFYSEGYKFLKAVRDRDGDVVTEMLNEPGTTVINARDITTGETGLHIAAARRDVLWVRFLLQRGADPNIRDNKGLTPLQIATTLGEVEAVEELISKGAQVDVADSQGETPLIAAVHQRNVPLVRRLLAQGADPDRNDNSGRSARDYMELQRGNSLMRAEFEAADKAREGEGTKQQYGPSF
ncbi:ankyrin repeat domain-containing protein [Erythrobacter sp.]|uniref:ankyrin repeat domain-containing protein n=1 Tax=Erythrobacter sp. TaxID=1042 RepID=UPI0025BBA576|nr:ankyrin repeat domain-containing protein [Erythrobacter sp.]